MLDMKDFEGIKRIENKNDFDIKFLYDTLLKYQKEIGKISLEDDKKIIADVEGKYVIEIYLTSKHIVIERKIEKNYEEAKLELGTSAKPIDMSKADRMIEQIYDLLNTMSENGIIKEPITSAKRILFAKQEKTFFKNHFILSTEEGKNIYEIKENKILKEFSVTNLETKRKNISIQYTGVELGKYSISTNSYTNINIEKSKTSIKTLFSGNVNNKPLTIRADYSDNHYLIELNEIVIGAIDSLDAETKDAYRLEINNIDYEYLIIALAVIIDLNYGNN